MLSTERPALSRPYLRGSPGKLSPERKREYGLELLRVRRTEISTYGKSQWSYRRIAVAVDVNSATTIMNWDTLDMRPEAILYRQSLKARARKFTLEEESILAGWVIYNDLTMQSTTTGSFREFVFLYFGEFMQSSYISKFMDRNFLSLKLVGNASAKDLERETILSESVEWLEALSLVISTYSISKERIKVFDKTYLASSPFHKHIKHIGPTGSVKPRKISPDKGPSMALLTHYSFFHY